MKTSFVALLFILFGSHTEVISTQEQMESCGNKIYLKAEHSLLFQANSYVQNKDGSMAPQLTCHGYCYLEPESIQCINMGWHETGVNWQCEAKDLSEKVRITKAVVTCQQWAAPQDFYVARDTCRLVYTLDKENGQSREEWSQSWGEWFPSFINRHPWLGVPILMLISFFFMGPFLLR